MSTLRRASVASTSTPQGRSLSLALGRTTRTRQRVISLKRYCVVVLAAEMTNLSLVILCASHPVVLGSTGPVSSAILRRKKKTRISARVTRAKGSKMLSFHFHSGGAAARETTFRRRPRGSAPSSLVASASEPVGPEASTLSEARLLLAMYARKAPCDTAPVSSLSMCLSASATTSAATWRCPVRRSHRSLSSSSTYGGVERGRGEGAW